MATKKTAKAAVAGSTRGATALASQTRRSADSPPPSPLNPAKETIDNCRQARTWLENKNLLVPEGSSVTAPMLSATLFYISELARMPEEIAKAIRSVAWLLGELEEETIAISTRNVVNDHLDYLNSETKNLLDDLKSTLKEETAKQVERLGTTAAKAVEEKIGRQPSYRDAILRNGSIPQGTDPRVMAREGIRFRQFILDFPEDAPIRKLGQEEVLRKFNEAMESAEGSPEEGKGRVRSVQRLANKGFLGEFLHDDGAKWFAKQSNADLFFAALGEIGVGVSLKKRSHPMIAYFVPLSLNPDNPRHIAEIAEFNNLTTDDILKIRWAKPPARRSPNQICGHLIINFSNPDAANRAKTEGLVICNKRVSVAKHKKEPIRCLKCHGWNHIASECVQSYDRCGSCGARDHRTSACTDKATTYCINCESTNHASWSRDCPTFVRKCREFDEKHPENSLPYYPSTESWTWAPNPRLPEPSLGYRPGPSPPLVVRGATQKLRQQTLRFGTHSDALGNPSQVPRSSREYSAARPGSPRAPTFPDPLAGITSQHEDHGDHCETWYL